MAVLQLLAQGDVELHAEPLDVVFVLLAVIDEGVDHPDGDGILEDVEAEREREPFAAVPEGPVHAAHLDDGGDGAAALHFCGGDAALEMTVAEDVLTGTVFRPGDQAAAGDDFTAVHRDALDDAGAGAREGDLVAAVVNDDAGQVVLDDQGRLRSGFLAGGGAEGLLVRLDGVQRHRSGLAGAEGGVESHPFDGAVAPAGEDPVLVGDDAAGGVRQGESALFVHRALGERHTPALPDVVARGLVDPVQVDAFCMQAGRPGQRRKQHDHFLHGG